MNVIILLRGNSYRWCSNGSQILWQKGVFEGLSYCHVDDGEVLFVGNGANA